MKAGAAEVDITPSPGIELSGFLAREQPSTSVLDPLFARALFVEDGNERLLWVHADLLGFDRPFVARFCEWAEASHGIPGNKVILSATHTHSAPTSMELIHCGKRDEAYVEELLIEMQSAAGRAIAVAEPAELATAVHELNLAIDRRRKPTAHIDPRVSAVGFRRLDGTFVAAALNYAMHPVALGAINRAISADWCGYAAARATEMLPGRPIVLMTNGAAGNINPPGENVGIEQVKAWGGRVANAIVPKLLDARPIDPSLKVVSTSVDMPLQIWSEQQIDAAAETQIRATKLPAGWGDRYVSAIRCWQENRRTELARGIADKCPMEIVAFRLGDLIFVTAGGEFFSRYADLVREASGRDVHIIGYANGNFGYVPTSAAYDEGGYEVDSAHFFYNTFRARRGAFEQLACDAGQLVLQL